MVKIVLVCASILVGLGTAELSLWLLYPAPLRFVYPQELEALLHYNGLAVRDAYGDWDRRPLAADSPRMIYVCQARS